MAATTMFPKLGYVPTSPKMEPASPPIDLTEVEPHETRVEPHHHKVEPRWGGEDMPTIEVYGEERKDPQATSCNFCTHLANRLDAKIEAMRRSRRHIPYGLKKDAREIRHQANNHTTRDADRHLSCPLLRNHTCDMCGQKGHTRSRCAPCGYCGEVGHIHNECPSALADDRDKGMTVVLKGVSPEMLLSIRALIAKGGTKVPPSPLLCDHIHAGSNLSPEDIDGPTDDDVLQMLCGGTKVPPHTLLEMCYGYAEDDEGVWDEISLGV